MTVSQNFSYNPTLDEIIRQSCEIATTAAMGRKIPAAVLGRINQHLNTVLKSLSNRGANLTQMERMEPISAPAGGAEIVLPQDTIEVMFPIMCKVPGQDSETTITEMAWEEYQTISNKESRGTPTRGWVEKTNAVKLVLWPIPSVALILRVRRQRLIRDADPGSTSDLTQRWFQAIVYSLAHKIVLASSFPLTQAQYLDGLAQREVKWARGRENEGGDIKFTLPDL